MIKDINDGIDIRMIRKLISTKEDTYELYQYGPYLTSYRNDFFLKALWEIKNPLLLYFTDIARLINISNDHKDYSIRKMKEMICEVKHRAEKRYDKYSDLVVQYCDKVLTDISTIMRKGRVTESAMLNCAPIVCYGSAMLVKSEVSDLKKGDPNPIQQDLREINFMDIDLYKTKMMINETIENCLRDYIIPIIINSSKYIITNNQELIDVLKEYNGGMKSEIDRQILNYRIAVYMKYNVDTNGSLIFNILNNCNIIRNGGRIDINHAVESLSFP